MIMSAIRSRRNMHTPTDKTVSSRPVTNTTKLSPSPIPRTLHFLTGLLILIPAVYLFVDPRYSEHRPPPGKPSFPSLTASDAAYQNGGNIEGRVFVLTGPYGGLGTETAKALFSKGGTIILGGRSKKKLDALAEELSVGPATTRSSLETSILDLSDLSSVKDFAQRILTKYADTGTRITIINNAATICPAAATYQHLEMQMGVNVVGHFLLNKILLPITQRQVWLSSTAHQLLGGPRLDLEYQKQFSLPSSSYDLWKAYQQSKLGDILLASEFHRRYPQLETASLHPGVIWTSMGEDIYGSGWWGPIYDSIEELPWLIGTEGWWFVKTPQQGAATTVTVASLSNLESGAYYKDSVVHVPSEAARNVDDAKALFDWCEQVTKEFQ